MNTHRARGIVQHNSFDKEIEYEIFGDEGCLQIVTQELRLNVVEQALVEVLGVEYRNGEGGGPRERRTGRCCGDRGRWMGTDGKAQAHGAGCRIGADNICNFSEFHRAMQRRSYDVQQYDLILRLFRFEIVLDRPKCIDVDRAASS